MSETKQRLNSLSDPKARRALHKLFGDNTPQIVRTLFDYTNGNIGTATGAGLSPQIWSDCPRGLMLVDPTVGHFVGDDFTLANGESFTTAKNYTLAGANGLFTHVASDPNGVALCNAQATDNNACNVNVNSGVGLVTLSGTSTWWFEARVKLNQITTGQGAFVGLVGDQITLGVDFMTDTTMALKVQDVLGFQVISPAGAIVAAWQAMYNKTAGTRTVANATAAATSTGWIKLGMKCRTNGTVGTITYYVNGESDANTILTSATNFPEDLYAVPAFAIKCGSAAANTLSVDWWYAAQLR